MRPAGTGRIVRVENGLFLLLLLAVICLPKGRTGVASPWPLSAVILLIELSYQLHRLRGRKGTRDDIIIFVWLLLFMWEMLTSVLGLGHPVLIPSPENVFAVLVLRYRTMLLNTLYSLELLFLGAALGLSLSTAAGLICGRLGRLRAFLCPIANVLAPIPAVVISPYLVALMPSFRSASVLVVFLGVFWPSFLGTVASLDAVDPRLLDSARMLGLKGREMTWKILLPAVFPSMVGRLKITMTTAVLMLNFAELMGASHGLGYYIQNSIAYANYTNAVAGILMVGLVVTFMNKIITLIQKKVIHWQ